VLAAALVGGVAWATIPDAAGVINGCYRTSIDDQKGQLRVVDDPASCRSNESPIQWSQEGPKGDTGAQGIQGTKGDTGATGPQGPKGDKGDTGAAGTNGANGVDGKDGQPGTNGTDGVDGTNGADGEPGLPGQNGTDGADGVSVTSAPEPAGANCASGGSKFTAANGVTFACNGSAGSGSGGPVLISRSAVAQFADLQSRVIVTINSIPEAVVTCVPTSPGNTVAIVGGFSGAPVVSAFASEGLTPTMTFTPAGAFGGSAVVAKSDEPPNPRPFAVTWVLTNGLSVNVRGVVSAGPPGPSACSIAYHVTVSKN